MKIIFLIFLWLCALAGVGFFGFLTIKLLRKKQKDYILWIFTVLSMGVTALMIWLLIASFGSIF